MWDQSKKCLIKYIFFAFYESKKHFKAKGTFFSLKMRYLNKQGQQASLKNWKHPDEVITRWRSYTIWRYYTFIYFITCLKTSYLNLNPALAVAGPKFRPNKCFALLCCCCVVANRISVAYTVVGWYRLGGFYRPDSVLLLEWVRKFYIGNPKNRSIIIFDNLFQLISCIFR